MIRFDHVNFNVLDLDKSLQFYADALDLHPVREHVEEDFRIVFLGDGKSPFSLELTWLKDREKPYDLGRKGIPPGLYHRPVRRAAQPPRANGRDLLRKPFYGDLFHCRPGRLLD